MQCIRQSAMKFFPIHSCIIYVRFFFFFCRTSNATANYGTQNHYNVFFCTFCSRSDTITNILMYSTSDDKFDKRHRVPQNVIDNPLITASTVSIYMRNKVQLMQRKLIQCTFLFQFIVGNMIKCCISTVILHKNRHSRQYNVLHKLMWESGYKSMAGYQLDKAI